VLRYLLIFLLYFTWSCFP